MKRKEILLVIAVFMVIVIFLLIQGRFSAKGNPESLEGQNMVLLNMVTAAADLPSGFAMAEVLDSSGNAPDSFADNKTGLRPTALVRELRLSEGDMPVMPDNINPWEQQKEPDMINGFDRNKPAVALTFDDGPSQYTELILDILREYDAKGTFFVLGDRILGREKIIADIFNQGSELGNHSLDHSNFTKLNQEEICENLEKASSALFNVTGKAPVLMRPPYGAIDANVINSAIILEMPIITWSIDTLDWKDRDAEKIFKMVMEEVEDGSIILFHDLYETTLESIEYIVPALIEQGYQLVTVSELLELNEDVVVPGNIYRNVSPAEF